MNNFENKKEDYFNFLQIVNNKVIKIALIILMFSMVSILSLNVLTRYLFNFSLTFSAELAGYFMVWIAFLGTITLYYNNDHINVDLIEKLFIKNSIYLRILHIFQNVACAMFFLILIYYGFQFFNMTSNQACASIEYLPLNYIYLIIPISGIFLLIDAMIKLYYIIISKEG